MRDPGITAAVASKTVHQSLPRRFGGALLSLLRNPREWKQWVKIIIAMVRRPHDATRWIRDRLRPQTAMESGLPWLSWASVDYLNSYLKPGMNVLEFGGGGSTIFFVKCGCRVTTIEGYEDWIKAIDEKLQELDLESANCVEFRQITLPDDDGEMPAGYAQQVHDGGPWDLVLVDARFRLECIAEARSELKPGALLILDNAYFRELDDAPQVMDGFDRIIHAGLGVARPWVTQTDVYRRATG